jgi:quinol monooxygenase YgiN
VAIVMSNHTIVMHGRLGAKEGKRDALAANLLRAAATMNAVAACRLYVVSTTASDPNGVWVTEMWDSAEDHAASLKHPETQKLIAETLPLIAELPQRGPNLSVLGGKGP